MRVTGTGTRRALARTIGILAATSLAVLGLAVPPAGAAELTVCATGCDFTEIQPAIDGANAGDTITVAAGTYAGNLTISKRITIQGAGSTADDTVSTILTPTDADLTGNAVTGNVVIYITGTGGGAADRVVLRDLRVTGATGSSNQGTGILVWEPFTGYLTIDGVVSTGNGGFGLGFNTTATTIHDVVIADSSFTGNSDGFKVGEAAKVDGMTITGSHFDGNGTYPTGQGVYWAQGYTLAPSPAATGLMTNVSVSGSTFSNNGDSGLYMNKVDHATFDGITVSGNARRGMDFAYRYGPNGNVSITDSTFTGNGGYGIQVRPRGVETSPKPNASASNFTISGNTVSGSPAGVILVGALDLGTTEVSNNAISGTTYGLGIGYEAAEGTPTGAPLIEANALTATVAVGSTAAQALDLSANWWGQDTGPAAGQAVTSGGALTTTPWIHQYTDDPAMAGEPGFWPIDVAYGSPVVMLGDGDDPATATFDDPATGASIGIDLPTLEKGGTLEVESLTAPGADLPSATFSAGSVFFDVAFDGTLTGPATICLTYPGGGNWPAGSKLYHYVGGAWNDVTTSLSGTTLCGEVDSFSPFAAGILTMGSPPVVESVTATPATQTYGGDVLVEASVTDPEGNGTITSVEYTIDGGTTWYPMTNTMGTTWSATITKPDVGSYTVYVRATDDAANTSDGTASDDFDVTTAPTLIAFTGNAYTTNGSTVKLEATVQSVCKADRTVTFELDTDGDGYDDGSFTGDTNTAGVATVTTSLPSPTIADVRVSVAEGNCAAAEGYGVVVVAGQGDASNGGGAYNNPGRINFGYALQKKLDKRTQLSTVSGRILWSAPGKVRATGLITGYSTAVTCPAAGDGSTPSGTCGLITGSVTISTWDVDHWVTAATNVSFRLYVRDGGTSVSCLRKTCTTTLKPDWIAMSINGGDYYGESATLFQIKGGNISVK